MRASFKRPKVESSGVAPPLPSSTGDTAAEESVDPAVATAVPPPSTSSDSSIWSMLDTVITIQATHGQLLVNVLIEL